MIESMINTFKEDKKLRVLLICVVIVLAINVTYKIYQSFQSKNYENIKVDKNKEYVYKLDYETVGMNKIPVINLDIKGAKKINEEIVTMYENLTELNDNNVFTYAYNKSGRYLSVMITKSKEDLSYNGVYTDFKSYVFDLQAKKVLTGKEIQKIFSVTDQDIEKKLEKQFKKYYSQFVKDGHIPPQECDYECFLGWRDIKKYTDHIQCYINKNKLYVYRGFEIYSVYAEEDVFTYEDYIFLISD